MTSRLAVSDVTAGRAAAGSGRRCASAGELRAAAAAAGERLNGGSSEAAGRLL